jgi:hypothetical protein
MGIDAVVVGAIASVVISLIVVVVIGYRIIKNMDDSNTEK